MTKKAKIVTKEIIHKGYLQLYKYDLELPSLDVNKDYITFKKREIIQTYDSILVLIFAPEIDSLVLCKEFRPGIFFNLSNDDDTFILECVSGTIDSNNTPEETAIIEVAEETGLSVDKVKLFAMAYKSPGILTEKTYIYYAETKGTPENGLHGIDDEEIMTCVIPRKKVYQLMDEMKILDAASLIALNWFRAVKK